MFLFIITTISRLTECQFLPVHEKKKSKYIRNNFMPQSIIFVLDGSRTVGGRGKIERNKLIVTRNDRS